MTKGLPELVVRFKGTISLNLYALSHCIVFMLPNIRIGYVFICRPSLIAQEWTLAGYQLVYNDRRIAVDSYV